MFYRKQWRFQGTRTSTQKQVSVSSDGRGIEDRFLNNPAEYFAVSNMSQPRENKCSLSTNFCVVASLIPLLSASFLSEERNQSLNYITSWIAFFQAKHANVAQVACDCLQLLCDKANVLLEFYPNVPAKIIQVNIKFTNGNSINLTIVIYFVKNLSETLQLMAMQEKHSALTISMLFCLGEWAMHLGPNFLLRVFQGKPLLMTLFTVNQSPNV